MKVEYKYRWITNLALKLDLILYLANYIDWLDLNPDVGDKQKKLEIYNIIDSIEKKESKLLNYHANELNSKYHLINRSWEASANWPQESATWVYHLIQMYNWHVVKFRSFLWKTKQDDNEIDLPLKIIRVYQFRTLVTPRLVKKSN